ncbi:MULTISPECIES: riboflavin synthase [Novosphingobium]|uniref:riboflavin synthase n=1 Tax=Novosphingobium TaxID=165696 RepID=UPI001CD25C8D|nr:riboflavin synthase [Novosphingobium percolationis]
MFTGIVTEIGTITRIEDRGDKRMTIACAMDPAKIAIGASIACSGVCLTVVDRGGVAGDAWFAVDVSGETISCTAPAHWAPGAKLNLEGALKLGDELGGHIVTGHVDGVGHVVGICPEGGSIRIGISAPSDLAPYIAAKGSITVDGTSLTVNEVTDQSDGSCHFALNIIPHTAEVTTIGALVQGDAVNLEIDVLARYLKRMQSLSAKG